MEHMTSTFLTSLAKCLATQFGNDCEIVVHDLRSRNLESSIIAIENGHVSGRNIGDGPSHVVLEALQDKNSAQQDRYSYLTKTKDAKILKSSTMFIRDEKGEIAFILAINYDISVLLNMAERLTSFTELSLNTAKAEIISQNVNDILDEMIEQSVVVAGKPVALMTKEDKLKAIAFLNSNGAFLITKSGQKVCNYFGISKYTLYSYIDEVKGQE